MPNDDDSTPRTGNKHSTQELPALELMQYQIRELKKGFQRSDEQNTMIISALQDIKSQMQVGTFQFTRHDERIGSLEKRADKGTWALLVALATVAWELLKANLKLLIVAAILISVSGCQVESRADLSPVAAKPSTVAEARNHIAFLEQELYDAHRDLSRLVDDERATVLYWTAGGLGLAGLACVVLAFALPIGKRIFIGLAIGLGSAACLALWLGAHAHWLPYYGLGLILTAVAVAVWQWRRHLLAAVTMAGHWQEAMKTVAENDKFLAADMNAESKGEQGTFRTIIDRYLDKATHG